MAFDFFPAFSGASFPVTFQTWMFRRTEAGKHFLMLLKVFFTVQTCRTLTSHTCKKETFKWVRIYRLFVNCTMKSDWSSYYLSSFCLVVFPSLDFILQVSTSNCSVRTERDKSSSLTGHMFSFRPAGVPTVSNSGAASGELPGNQSPRRWRKT